jgi:hypothetical protein
MQWEPFQTVFRATGVSTVTLYINQESTSSSVVADLNVFQLITQSNQPQNYTFSCASKWRGESGVVKCSSFGGKSNVIELAHAGSKTHAYQEFAVTPDALYVLRGQFYSLVQGECDKTAAVKWCSPSVVVCPGLYDPNYYKRDKSPCVCMASWLPTSATGMCVSMSVPQVPVDSEYHLAG